MSFMLERRRFLAGAGAVLAVAPFAAAHAEIAHLGARSLSFDNLHTGEKLSVDYWADGAYIPDALQTINHVLRDYRNNEVHVIEPKLLDLLTILRARLDTPAAFEVISGYRSPATNAMLHAESSGVAAKSLHMQGMAIDIRVANRSLQELHNSALSLHAGGVGYYPTSDFVHVDVGRVRMWGGV
jgi:uncharacterized protein YcbK (DUF882 family)